MMELRRLQQRSQTSQSQGERVVQKSSSFGLGTIMVLLGILLLVGPIVVLSSGAEVPFFSGTLQVMIMGLGLLLFLVGAITTIITRLYHRAPADRAFVRTGMGGAQMILDGGALVIPVVHEVIWVTLRTLRFEVSRTTKDALLTKDYLRADVTCEFFVKVPKEPQSVQTAATSLGQDADKPDGIRTVIEKKLDSAIRQVAAEMTLDELLVNRAEFLRRVSEHVSSDIANNGLKLENVTLSKLDQTLMTTLQTSDNIFDAQGARKITEITTAQNVEQNRMRLDAQRRIKAEQVLTDQFEYEQEVARAQAEAERDRKIQVAQATAKQEAATQAAEQDQLAQVAGVSRDRAVELAQIEQAQATAVANQTREQAERSAEILKNQTLEVASRQQEVAIANAETERATAQAQQLAAETERVRRTQEMTTVEVTAKAERDKAQTVIGAQAEAEKRRVNEQVAADIAAYTTVTNATAEQDAADRIAAALTTRAKAEQQAAELKAAGDKAILLVPVQVSREQVDVDAAEVEVLQSKLATQAEHESISRGLQVDLARIAADRDVQMEAARSFGVALSSANMTIWGDPDTVARMSQAFLKGQQNGRYVDGLANTLPSGVKDSLSGFGNLLSGVLKEKLGIDVSPTMIEEEIAKAQGGREVVTKN